LFELRWLCDEVDANEVDAFKEESAVEREQADKDDADAADDESDSDIGSDDGQVAAWLQTAVCFVFVAAKLNLDGFESCISYFLLRIWRFLNKGTSFFCWCVDAR
jgi:hypothetical protein